MYKEARKQGGFTIEEAAYQLHIAPRTLCKYESGDLHPSPETVLAMNRVYKTPAIAMLYCRKGCAIGKAYCFELLNNVDLSPMAIITKYRQEEREAGEAIEHLSVLILNKKDRQDCSDEELQLVRHWVLELLDLEHVIQLLKLRLWDFCDITELVGEHNRKCLNKNYYDPGRPELELVG